MVSVCARMRPCVSLRIRLSMRQFVDPCVSLCMCLSMSQNVGPVSVYARVCAPTSVCLRACLYMCLHVCPHVCLCTCLSMCLHVRPHVCLCTCLYICLHVRPTVSVIEYAGMCPACGMRASRMSCDFTWGSARFVQHLQILIHIDTQDMGPEDTNHMHLLIRCPRVRMHWGAFCRLAPTWLFRMLLLANSGLILLMACSWSPSTEHSSRLLTQTWISLECTAADL